MKAKQLLDSRKFCLLMDDLVRTWKDKKATDDDKEMRLEAVLEIIAPDAKPLRRTTYEFDATTMSAVPKEEFKGDYPIFNAVPLPKEAIPAIEKVKRAYKKRQPMIADNEPKAADKKALLEQMRAPLTPEEIAELKKQALADVPTEESMQETVNTAVKEVIKPNWASSPDVDGCKHFHVKANRNGKQVSFDKEKWEKALRLHKLPAGNVTFKIEGLSMSGDVGGSAGSPVWRVMIG